ncbi:response regulator transcription factor [Porticoccus sp. W117]|uniref:response regulator transcription factor n=1 Tax=Porticoccus sp. W117 TaxID=3054777 RepID=UPI0025918D95|nr:response regulator transcription factor [Porticoccus sp. W117]MDM3871997.1 response regulator transcription factor [Porticoccus sp. W117]
MTDTKRKWLLVDDDATFSATLCRSLQRRDEQVAVANTAEDALALAAKEQPSHAVLDLKLAESSGLHLLQELKQLLPDCQVVILTGYSSVATAVEAIKLGALNYLCKPVTLADILSAFDGEDGDPDTAIADTPPSMDRLEWEHIQRVLAENHNNISASARQLGMHRRTLQRKLQKRPVKK